MNVAEYISSGIIESCVLGLADDQERAEFERMCAAYPEVLAARQAFELNLENQMRTDAKHPPAQLKEKVFSALKREPVPLAAEEENAFGGENHLDQQLHRIPGDSRPRVMKMRFERLLAVASLILLAFSTLLNFYFFGKYKESSNRIEALLAAQSDMAQQNNSLQTRLVEYESAVQLMKDPQMAIVKLQAVPTAPDPASSTTLYWNTNTKDVYLTIGRLPAPPQDQQYQLWAIVDGKPVDAGVFEINEGPGMMKMKNIVKAEAFAITLERKGGSAAPTIEKMYVMGKV